MPTNDPKGIQIKKFQAFPGPKIASEKIFKSNEVEVITEGYPLFHDTQYSSETIDIEVDAKTSLYKHKSIKQMQNPMRKSYHPIIQPKFKLRTQLGDKKSTLLRTEIPPISVLHIQEMNKQLEYESLLFKEDPLQYFLLADGTRSQDFIYMKYEMDPDDQNFNPYLLKRIPSVERGNDYFTMSHKAVSHIVGNKQCDIIPLHLWAKEASSFVSIRKLDFFLLYKFWHCFRLWKSNGRYNRFSRIHSICSRILLK